MFATIRVTVRAPSDGLFSLIARLLSLSRPVHGDHAVATGQVNFEVDTGGDQGRHARAVRPFFKSDDPELGKALQGAREARFFAPGECRERAQRGPLVKLDRFEDGEIAWRQQLDHRLGRDLVGARGGLLAVEPLLGKFARGLGVANDALGPGSEFADRADLIGRFMYDNVVYPMLIVDPDSAKW
jgi:hypothetical protein